MSGYLGEIRIFAGNFAPINWALCNGQTLKISENQALFTLLGTAWGGDGITNFGIPDFRGRIPVCQGTGSGLTARAVGQTGGAEAVTIIQEEMPAHTHALMASPSPAVTQTPGPGVIHATVTPYSGLAYVVDTTDTFPRALNEKSIDTVGWSYPHPNVMPSIALNFIIALSGEYPVHD